MNVDCDIVLYSLFCTPCLFGENSYKLTKYPSCVYYTLSYSLSYINGCMIGAVIGNCIIPNNIFIIFTSTLLSNALISETAGNMRIKLRNELNIEGSEYYDFCIHFFCPQYAIAEEAQILRNNVDSESIPLIQKMVI